MLEGEWKTITKGQDNNWFVTSHNSSDTGHRHTTHCLCFQSSYLILFTSNNRGDEERKQTFKNKLLHFNFVTFLWPGKPWQKLHVFLRETGQKKHRCTWKQVQTPFSPVDLYASDHFRNAYPKELSSATNHLCWRRLHLTAVVAVVTFVESAITWLGPGRGRDGARRGGVSEPPHPRPPHLSDVCYLNIFH